MKSIIRNGLSDIFLPFIPFLCRLSVLLQYSTSGLDDGAIACDLLSQSSILLFVYNLNGWIGIYI